ncbi:Na+/H+ antiporter subunit E [Haloimpatiens sp. FM7330]|uniref:Na+/H+ antiporter subunit E n=1 Tax=Haloimpatiens sp. FM7330 TaxID=3298610 RepID=UPI0036303052
MKNYKAIFSTFILCFIFWILYTYSGGKVDSEEVVAGIIVSFIVALFSSKFFIREDAFWLFNFKRLGSLIAFIPIYFVELFKANLDVALRALSPKVNINPGIVKIETELKSDYGLSMLANCITLTPGTITMDIVEQKNKCYMYIHWIDVKDKNIEAASDKIKGNFEPWVRRIFR